jgi:hypothetical protein
MPQCKQCEKTFQRRVHLDGKPILLSDSRSSCLDCTPYKKMGRPRNRRRVRNKQLERYCKHCDKWLRNDAFRYETGQQCIECRNQRARPRTASHKLQLKQQAVTYMGSHCGDCGNQFPLCAYDFHHLDPTQKDFQISRKTNFATAKQELDKCIMLCKNCHSIRHVKNEGFLETP